MPTIITRLPYWLALAGILLVVTGCKTTSKHVRWYDGPPKQTNEVAMVEVQWSLRTAILTVNKIDGVPLAKGRFIANITREIELLPGQHELSVSYRDAGDRRSTQDAQIIFTAEMGKSYKLHGAPLPVKRIYGKAATYYWTLWIIDAETKKVVAGVPRTTPLHWYE